VTDLIPLSHANIIIAKYNIEKDLYLTY